MFQNKVLLEKIFIENEIGEEYIAFQHDDKTWIMPTDSMRMAFDMYQPSTVKGKILKNLVLCCKNISIVASKLGATKIRMSINENIKSYVKDIVGMDGFWIAGYMGDTSSKQNNKATLQVYSKKKILCYIKVTTEKDIAETFRWEIEGLKHLEKCNGENVPRVLTYDCVDGIYTFVQSTEKRAGKKLLLNLKEQQVFFVKTIVDKTKKEMDYEETDFKKFVSYLKIKAADFKPEQLLVITKAIDIIEEKLKEKPQEYAFSHGDFTPWNVYYVDGAMEAFDFEYCNYSMPCYIDVFHYLTQLSVLGKKNEVGGTVHLYKKYRNLLEQYICDPDFTYACYLIYIISFYKQRTESNVDISEKYEQWVGLLEYILEKIDKENKDVH